MNENVILNFIGGGGGGTSLNFDVIPNPQPASAKENTIWIDTEVITGWIFSASEPDGIADDGMVWISTGESSPVEFNALKKNGVMVYPLSAKQYVNGEWVAKTVKIYQGGEWVEPWNGILYDYGHPYGAITGGWVGSNTIVGSTASGGKIVFNEDHIQITTAQGGSFGAVTANSVDLTRFTTLRVLSSGSVRIQVAAEYPTSNQVINSAQSGTDTEHQIDISQITGAYKIAIANRSTTSNALVYRVWLT